MSTPVIRLSTPAGLASAVPALIGFTPKAGDLVVIGFSEVEGRKRVGLSLRVDLADLEPAMVKHLADTLVRNGVTELAVIVHMGEELAGRQAFLQLARVRSMPSIRTVLHVGVDGQVWCEDVCCPVPTSAGWVDYLSDPARTALVGQGEVVQPSREDVAKRVEWTGEWNAPAPDNQVVASIHWALRDTASRDAYLVRLCTLEGERLLVELDQLCLVTRYTGGSQRNTMLAVTAWAAYLTGNGALANVALEQVEGSMSLATLLRTALDKAVSPAMLREVGKTLA